MSMFDCIDKEGNRYSNMTIVDGLSSINKNMPVRLTQLKDGRLMIEQRFSKNKPVYIPYSQVTNAGLVTEEEIIEKSKSVVGRAAAGTLLLGPLGAIIGGMSGIGTKTKQKSETYFVINYRPDGEDEQKIISFKYAGDFPATYKKFTEELRAAAGI
jgi:hypothetical protein